MRGDLSKNTTTPCETWTKFLNALLRQKRFDLRETWFVNVYNGVGDAFFVLGFLKALRHRYKIKTLVILARESLRDIVELYAHAFDHAIYLDSDFPIDASFSDKFGPGFLVCASKAYYLGGAWQSLAVAHRIPHIDWYKFGLRLPMTAGFDSPKFIKTNYSEIIRNPKNCVVLLPYSNFTERLDQNCWEKVVSIIVKKGYKCYTNIQNKSWDFKMHGHIKRNEIKQEYEAVSGTMPLNCSIKDLFSIINAGAKVISGPGGLATILAFTSSDILVLQKKVVVDAGTINSTYRGEKWTSLDMVGAVKRGIPWRLNLRESFFDENIENTLSEFVGEITNN